MFTMKNGYTVHTPSLVVGMFVSNVYSLVSSIAKDGASYVITFANGQSIKASRNRMWDISPTKSLVK